MSLFNKIIFLLIFLYHISLFFFNISFANIEEEYFKIYKKLDYQKGVYGNASKYADLIYEYEGVTNNFRLYIDNTVQNQELILWNLDENWNENRIFVNKKVQEFWGFVNNYGIFIIYKRSSNIYWKIYQTNNGKEIIGGFLTSESILNIALKDVYFASYKKGAFVSLIFYDNLGKQYYYIYYLDVWGRHDLVTKKDNK
ncbi:MAG: hypothetical protein ACK4GJ_04000 [bacterium]